MGVNSWPMTVRGAFLILAAWTVAALGAPAPDLAGTWKTEFKSKNGVHAAELHLLLKGSQISGDVSMQGAKGSFHTLHIHNGAFDWQKFSFATERHNKKGKQRWIWEGRLIGGELQGSRLRDGAKKPVPFVARRG